MPTTVGTLVAGIVMLMAGVTTASSTPEQVHLSVAAADPASGYPSGMTVMWYTQDSTSASSCQFGLGGLLNRTAQGTATSYLVGEGFHHTVHLTGLRPEAKYTYRVGSDGDAWSDTFSFTSPPHRDDASFGIAMFGDMGWLGSQERPMVITLDGLVKNWTAVPTRARLEALKDEYQMVWALGDLAYADDAFAHDPIKFEYENTYNGWMTWMQNLSSTRPFMVSVGNHESECHSAVCLAEKEKGQALRNFTAYNKRWAMPSASSGGVLNMWYSFNYGPVHFVGLNTETDFPGAGEEHTGDSGNKNLPAGGFGRSGEYLDWLARDLAAAASPANRTARPWIIACGHRPGMGSPDVAKLFDQYGVDMYFAGHTHSYVRSMPSINGRTERHHPRDHYADAQSTTHIVVGGAGCDEMPFIGQSSQSHAYDRAEALASVPAGSAVEDVATAALAAGVLSIANRSALRWRLYGSVDGSVMDELWLTKSLS